MIKEEILMKPKSLSDSGGPAALMPALADSDIAASHTNCEKTKSRLEQHDYMWWNHIDGSPLAKHDMLTAQAAARMPG